MIVNNKFFLFAIMGVIYFFILLLFNGEHEFILLFIVIISQLIIIYTSKLIFDSPLLWYTSAVFIYHFSSLIMFELGFYVYSNKNESLFLYGLIYYFSALPLFLFRKNNDYSFIWQGLDRKLDKRVLILFYFIFSFLTILLNIKFLMSGVTDKGDAILNGIIRYNFVYNWFTVISIVFLVSIRDSKKYIFYFILTLIVCLFTSLNTGERDVILNFILTFLVLNISLKKISKKKALIVIMITGLSIPILQGLKTIFIKDVTTVISGDALPFVVRLLQGEFMSASRNLDWLLARNNQYDLFLGANLIKDILVGISPISLGIQNSQTWFNETFFPNIVATGQGYGFSLYGSFLISFGFLGLVFLTLLYSLFLVIFFNKRYKSPFLFLLSLFMITPAIYSQRGDLSVVLSYIIKQNILPLLMVYACSLYMRGKIVIK